MNTIVSNLKKIILKSLEPVYRLFFFVHQKYRHLKGHKRYKHIKVISIGNISAGGTGKSVVSQFILNLLTTRKTCALLLRGYKSTCRHTSCVVSYKRQHLSDVIHSGDEAFMHGELTDSVVVIGKNRHDSLKTADQYLDSVGEKLDIVVLDDAYQNHALEKDFEVVLLDARRPFDNFACFPAGLLREKDLSRADVLILTHANVLREEERKKLIRNISVHVTHNNIFFSRHTGAGYFLAGKKRVEQKNLEGKKCGVVAGLGSFDAFFQSVVDDGIRDVIPLQFPDHHSYSMKDVDAIARFTTLHEIDGLISTRKDWVKLTLLFDNHPHLSAIPVYVRDVGFAFLSKREHERFVELLYSRI